MKIKIIKKLKTDRLHILCKGFVAKMDTKLSRPILIVDDEDRIRRLLRMYLERENYFIEEATNGTEAINMIENNDYQCVLLDIMMPEMNGLEVCEKVRELKSTPIILLTAKGEESDRIKGFELGADDYVIKPFSPREVILRVKALIKRFNDSNLVFESQQPKDIMVFPHITIDHTAHRVTAEDKEVSLTPKEYDLLHFLAKNPDKVFEREELLKEVWHYDFFGDLRTVDTHVKRLREKLNAASPDAAKTIGTIWGIGYKFQIQE